MAETWRAVLLGLALMTAPMAAKADDSPIVEYLDHWHETCYKITGAHD